VSTDNVASSSPLRNIGASLSEIVPRVTVDAVDLELLRLLTQDGRMPQRRLAEELKMSAPAIAERLARLQKRGVITGYSANINFDALGYSTIVYLSVVIALEYDRGRLMNDLAQARGVEEVTLVTGSTDLLVKLRVRDHEHLRTLLTDEIWSIKGIQRTETSISLGHVGGLNPAERLLAEIAHELDIPFNEG
jgi:Lrp/AsnC family leucine-responsive transcriptional regulator